MHCLLSAAVSLPKALAKTAWATSLSGWAPSPNPGQAFLEHCKFCFEEKVYNYFCMCSHFQLLLWDLYISKLGTLRKTQMLFKVFPWGMFPVPETIKEWIVVDEEQMCFPSHISITLKKDLGLIHRCMYLSWFFITLVVHFSVCSVVGNSLYAYSSSANSFIHLGQNCHPPLVIYPQLFNCGCHVAEASWGEDPRDK